MERLARLKNGNFCNSQTFRRKRKALAAMAEAKRKKVRLESEHVQADYTICDGYRIVNIHELARNLKCINCRQVLSLAHITDEVREGLNCLFKIFCKECQATNIVSTSKKINLNNHAYSEVNVIAALGKFLL